MRGLFRIDGTLYETGVLAGMQQETLVDDALRGNINPKMNRRVPS
jgi:hypothetical protein